MFLKNVAFFCKKKWLEPKKKQKTIKKNKKKAKMHKKKRLILKKNTKNDVKLEKGRKLWKSIKKA